MNNYELMKLAEKMDDDDVSLADIDYEYTGETDADAFKREYKDFYTDIKLTIKEDW